MTILDELVTRLTIDDKGFVGGLRSSLLSVEAWKKQLTPTLKGMDQAFGSIVKTLKNVGIGAGIAGVAIGTMLVKNSLASVDALAKMADKAKVNIEAMAGMKLAADLAGVSIETVSKSIMMSQRAISEASTGMAEYADAIKMAGLSVEELRSLSPEDAFKRIADATNSMTNSADQLNVRMALLGRGGIELGNFLAIGSKGMEEAEERAKALGVAVSRVDAAKIEQANDAFTELQAAISGAGNSLAIALSPYLTQVAKDITDAAIESGGFKKELQDAVDAGVRGAARIADAWLTVRQALAGGAVVVATISESFWTLAGDASEGFSYIGQVISNFRDALVLTNASLMSSGVVLWEGLKVAVKSFADFTIRTMADLLDSTAQGMGYFSAEASTAMLEAAQSLRIFAHQSSVAVDSSFSEAKETAVQLAAETKDAWSNVFKIAPPDSDSITAAIREIAVESEAQLLAAQENLGRMLSTPPPSEGMLEWAANARAAIDAVANGVANKAVGGTAPHDTMFDPDELAVKSVAYQEALHKSLTEIQEQRLMFQMAGDMEVQLMKEQHLFNMEKAEYDSQARMLALWESGYQGRLDIASSILGQISTLTQSNNKKMFQAGKAAAIAEATINTYRAAVGAYAAMAPIPFVGPALGIAAAGAAIAAGVANVQKISSTSFGSKGGASSPAAGSGTGGATPPGGDPAGVFGGGGPARQAVNITLSGSNFSAQQVRDLIGAINDQTGDNMQLRAN